MNREKLDKWCERGILGLVLAILVYGPLATGAVRTPDFLVIQALSMGVLALWGIRLWLKPRPQILWTPMCWAVLAFIAYAVVRYFTSELEYLARQECVQVLLYGFLFMAILNNLHKQEHTQLIVYILVFLAMAISAYAIFQFATGSQKVWTFTTPYKGRASGTYYSPNNLAGFLEMILPLGLTGVLVSRAKPVMKVFLGYASLVILAGIAVSLSRGGWVAVSVALLALFGVLLFHRSYRIPAALLLLVLVGAGIFMVPKARFLKVRLEETTAHDRLNDSARFDLWKPAVRLWQENIWWGIGPNHYDARFRQHRPQTTQQQPVHVHNDYLNTLTDWGMVGLGLVLSAVGLLYVGVIRTWSFVRGSSGDLGGGNSNKFSLVLGAALGILAILIHSVIDFNMHIPANAILAICLMALLSSTVRFATSDHWLSLAPPAKLLLSSLLLGALICVGWNGIRSAREYVWLRRANDAQLYSSEQVRALENAFVREPRNFKTTYAIGESLRRQSLEGTSDYEALAEKAITWFERSIHLNPYHGYSYVGIGMSLDWLGRSDTSSPYYDKGIQLDPNGYFTAANVGWHYVQIRDYAAARAWFERSKKLEWNENQIADTYLPIVNQKLTEAAAQAVGSPAR